MTEFKLYNPGRSVLPGKDDGPIPPFPPHKLTCYFNLGVKDFALRYAVGFAPRYVKKPRDRWQIHGKKLMPSVLRMRS